jgi:hypothetical protein
MSEGALTIWRFVHSTTNRFSWSAGSIEKFSRRVRALGRNLDLKLPAVLDADLGAETPAYPLALLEMAARELDAPAMCKTLGFLLADLALTLDPGQSCTMLPAEICKRAVELQLGGLVASGETSQSRSLKSRIGKALTAASGKSFGDVDLSKRGRNRHRRYILTRRHPGLG